MGSRPGSSMVLRKCHVFMVGAPGKAWARRRMTAWAA